MAKRSNILDSFISELETVAGQYDAVDKNGNVIDTFTLDTSNIGLRDPEQLETTPSIVYHDNYRPIQYNGVGRSEEMVVYNNDGTVKEHQFREYEEAQFVIDVRGTDRLHEEPIYEAVHACFGEYAYGPTDSSVFDNDVINIEVDETVNADTGTTETTIRGDRITVLITYYRNYVRSTDNIETVEHGIDSDDDGTANTTYQTT